MTNYLTENLKSPNQLNYLWFGWFAQDMTDFGDKAMVILPDLSRDNQFGPCFWQSRDDTTMPQKGDRCCVMFDNQGHAWILAWWPFST